MFVLVGGEATDSAEGLEQWCRSGRCALDNRSRVSARPEPGASGGEPSASKLSLRYVLAGAVVGCWPSMPVRSLTAISRARAGQLTMTRLIIPGPAVATMLP